MIGKTKGLLIVLTVAFGLYSYFVYSNYMLIRTPADGKKLIWDAGQYFEEFEKEYLSARYFSNPDFKEDWLQVPGVTGLVMMSDLRTITIHHPEEIVSLKLDSGELEISYYEITEEDRSNLDQKLAEVSKIAWQRIYTNSTTHISVWLFVAGLYIAIVIITIIRLMPFK